MQPQHPFARYPYAPREAPPQHYVGPAWAAPGPLRHLPPRKRSGSGYLAAFLITAAGSFVLLVSIVLLAFLHAAVTPHRGAAPAVDHEGDDEATARPADGTKLPARRAVDKARLDRTAERSWLVDECVDEPMKPGDPERRSAYFLGYMGEGTAKRMRGKVAVVHLLLASPSLTWTSGRARDVDRAALLAARFFTTMAEDHGVTDLEYTPMAWRLSTQFAMPEIVTDPSMRIDPEASRALVQSALDASGASLGVTMLEVAATLRGEGFAEVAFLLHVPVKVDAREFAFPAPLLRVDAAVVFEEPLDRLGFVTAHETMHLFGADDLYPLDRFDSEDEDDLMRANCTGFGGLQIRDMSAFAIGWRPAAPARSYATTRLPVP